MIRTEKIKFSYEDKKVLKGISCEIAKEDFV